MHRAKIGAPEPRQVASFGRRLFRVARWVVLGCAAVAIGLVLRPKDPPEVRSDPQALRRLEAKLARLGAPAVAGGRQTLQFDESEVNALARSTLNLDAVADPARRQPDAAPLAPSSRSGSAASLYVPPPEPLSVEDVQSKVRDVRTRLSGDQIVAHVLFDLYGKNVSLELHGRLSVRDGYLRLDPTALWIGSFPVPEATVKNAVERLFSDPAHRETFRVPPGIRDVGIRDGQLFVVAD